MTKAETLRRIDRGLYDQPGFNKLTQKPNPPDPRSVIDAVGRRDQTRMLVDGMTAANDLGLTDAVPAKIVVHTDARRRAIKLGNVTITFRPTAASKLFWAGRPAMRVVQALHWLRDLLVREGENDLIKRKLARLSRIRRWGRSRPISLPVCRLFRHGCGCFLSRSSKPTPALVAGRSTMTVIMLIMITPMMTVIDIDRVTVMMMISATPPMHVRSRNRAPPRRNQPPIAAQPGGRRHEPGFR